MFSFLVILFTASFFSVIHGRRIARLNQQCATDIDYEIYLESKVNDYVPTTLDFYDNVDCSSVYENIDMGYYPTWYAAMPSDAASYLSCSLSTMLFAAAAVPTTTFIAAPSTVTLIQPTTISTTVELGGRPLTTAFTTSATKIIGSGLDHQPAVTASARNSSDISPGSKVAIGITVPLAALTVVGAIAIYLFTRSRKKKEEYFEHRCIHCQGRESYGNLRRSNAIKINRSPVELPASCRFGN